MKERFNTEQMAEVSVAAFSLGIVAGMIILKLILV